MLYRTLIASGLMALVVSGTAGASDADKAELKITAEESLGHNIGPTEVDSKLVFDGDKLSFKKKGADAIYSIKLDPSASPKVIDFTLLNGPNKGLVYAGLYHLEGNELWICFGRANHPRPNGFATRGLPAVTVYKCKRPTPPDKESLAEMKKLAGKWHAVSGEINGKPWPDIIIKTLTYDISEGRIDGTWNGTKGVHRFEVDPSTKPKTIRLVRMEGDKPEAARAHGCYQLDGDTLTICLGPESMPRPTAFETKPKSQQELYKFKRDKR
jgi:uncharacterized protein (TIGR03067 family)